MIKSGFLSTFQDMGRAGYTDIGLTHSGVMDEFSYLLANALLGDKEKACVEITFGNFEFEVMRDFSAAVCAIDGEVEINSQKYKINRTFKLKKGDIVKIKPLKKGNFAYLCVKNGFNAPKKYGSCSVSIREKILEPIKEGDVLKLKNPQTIPNRYAKISFNIPENLELRIIFGHQKELFDTAEFLNKEFQLKSINRQGAVLKGEVNPKKGDIISEGISFGSVQVPSSGDPIVLLKEHQTIGGYPKIGNVLPLDCFRLSQFRRGKIKFKEISLEDAKKEMIEFYSFFKKLRFSFIEMYH
ncbi:5-oxoprolinase subunit C family protein [Nautilia lithotrophica]